MPMPWEVNWVQKEKEAIAASLPSTPTETSPSKKPWEINWVDVTLKGSGSTQKQPTSDSKSLGDGLTLDTVFEGLKQAESGGVHIDAKTGKLVTSPAGAEGITQLMPKTAERPGYGIKPVQDKSEGEYLRVGKEYLAAMYKKYGDWEMSLAAYNAGSGSVDAAKGKAERFGGSWKDYLPKPKETLPYIDKILGRNPKGIVNATPDKMSEGLTGKQALENVKGVAYDVASMLPVSGEAISAKEAYDKLKQGDLSGSALAAVGAIPLVGSVSKTRNVLYRGIKEEGQRSSKGFTWATADKEYASKYGNKISEIALPDNARIFDITDLPPVARYDDVFSKLEKMIGEEDTLNILSKARINSDNELDVYSIFRNSNAKHIMEKHKFDAVSFKQNSDGVPKVTVGILNKEK